MPVGGGTVRSFIRGEKNYGVFEDNELRLSSVVQDSSSTFRFQVRFYDISENAFKWTMHTSNDGGETWFENVQMLDATRIR